MAACQQIFSCLPTVPTPASFPALPCPGLIPADTDYRMFSYRNYGTLPGECICDCWLATEPRLNTMLAGCCCWVGHWSKHSQAAAHFWHICSHAAAANLHPLQVWTLPSFLEAPLTTLHGMRWIASALAHCRCGGGVPCGCPGCGAAQQAACLGPPAFLHSPPNPRPFPTCTSSSECS